MRIRKAAAEKLKRAAEIFKRVEMASIWAERAKAICEVQFAGHDLALIMETLADPKWNEAVKEADMDRIIKRMEERLTALEESAERRKKEEPSGQP